MLNRIYLFHDAFYACAKQDDLVVQFVINLGWILGRIRLTILIAVLRLHVYQQVAELRLRLCHLLLGHRGTLRHFLLGRVGCTVFLVALLYLGLLGLKRGLSIFSSAD